MKDYIAHYRTERSHQDKNNVLLFGTRFLGAFRHPSHALVASGRSERHPDGSPGLNSTAFAPSELVGPAEMARARVVW
jgi:hypothetical protein